MTTRLEPHEDGTVSGWTHVAGAVAAELAVEDSRREPSEVYGMLSSLVAHVVLTGDGLAAGHTLSWDGETLPVSEGPRRSASRSCPLDSDPGRLGTARRWRTVPGSGGRRRPLPAGHSSTLPMRKPRMTAYAMNSTPGSRNGLNTYLPIRVLPARPSRRRPAGSGRLAGRTAPRPPRTKPPPRRGHAQGQRDRHDRLGGGRSASTAVSPRRTAPRRAATAAPSRCRPRTPGISLLWAFTKVVPSQAMPRTQMLALMPALKVDALVTSASGILSPSR